MPDGTYRTYLREHGLSELEDDFEAKAFMSYYKSSLRRTRFAVIAIFAITGILLGCAITKLLMAINGT